MIVSIIIPAYNEEKTIVPLLDKVISVQLPGGLEKEIIIVNDGSQDNTAGLLAGYQNKPNIKIFHQSNAGKTSALLAGIKKATGDIMLIQDADLEYNPIQHPQLLAPILEGKTQVVYGSRFLGKIDQMKWINRWANSTSNLTFRLLWKVNITDINTCYKIFTRAAFEGIVIEGKRFAFETEVTVKFLKKGLKIIEVPIEYQARARHEGKKINWRMAMEMYWPIIKYRFTKGC